MTAPQDVWVFHRGALGDSVLLWPRLRHRVRSGARVHLVTDRAKAELAAREIGVFAVDAEQRRFNELWREGVTPGRTVGAGLVVDHVSSVDATIYRRNLAAMFPEAGILHEPPPRGGREAAEWVDAHPLARVEPRTNDTGPVVLCVGAGSQPKRWPLERWRELAETFAGRVIAGEVEEDRFTDQERHAFDAMRGEFLPDLATLADALRKARLVVACDSGPAHLAAQLGVPTLALFGPTNPGEWAPVGPSVRVIAPAAAAPMEWLGIDQVAAEMLALQRQRPMK